ncbi:uncharacterized protein BX663DRAFT_552460 [Cokeromyces recurvatus]|uniref:uncharacterized protein n=1 Tax=Cokeromyces recurvatus TaxID=90255 RepID=UPI00221F2FB4|nr:uncharacterized protein BX663DRAFT_552460 [Cokeromyces recurvatus]KAI7902548.1 hypothetical protein BX663DRAFT_552460 [Cokeromyces recurvatus]
MPDSSTNQIKTSNGDEIASFYRSIISSSNNEDQSKNRQNNKVEKETWFCKSCEMSIPKSDYKRHIQGTAHLVSSNSSCASQPLAPDILTINGTNVGFRMLQSQGWKYEEGLGANSQGRRHPIATVLKQDRFGIGHQNTGKN